MKENVVVADKKSVKRKRLIRFMANALGALALCGTLTIQACAEENAITKGLTSLKRLIFVIVTAIGGILTIYGLISLGTGSASDNQDSQQRGIRAIVGGAIIVGGSVILGFFGIKGYK